MPKGKENTNPVDSECLMRFEQRLSRYEVKLFENDERFAELWQSLLVAKRDIANIYTTLGRHEKKLANISDRLDQLLFNSEAGNIPRVD